MNQTFYGCASITSSQRTDLVRKDVVPGPGTYRPKKQDDERIPMWTIKPKIQYTSCFHSNKLFVPAPGAYDLDQPTATTSECNRNSTKVVKYKDRNSIEKSSPVIALQIPSFVNQRAGFSFGYRDQVIVREGSPGPIYHPNQIQEQKRNKKVVDSSGFGIGQRSRVEKQQTPGPGNYSPYPEKMYATSGKWTFSKSPRKNKPLMANLTGPGEYNPQLYSTCRSFKLKGRYQEGKLDCFDTSPQSYNLPDTKSKRSAVIRKLPTNGGNEKEGDDPSPFSYQINSSLRMGGYSLGKKLQTIDHNAQNPGPGSYERDARLLAKNGGYICRKQHQKKKVGQNSQIFCKYLPKTEIIQYRYPQFTFKKSEGKAPQSNPGLGPGSYDSLKYSCSESYSIGKDTRFKPLRKQKSYGNTLTQASSFSSCGYLPGYLKDKTVKQAQNKISQKQNMV